MTGGTAWIVKNANPNRLLVQDQTYICKSYPIVLDVLAEFMQIEAVHQHYWQPTEHRMMQNA